MIRDFNMTTSIPDWPNDKGEIFVQLKIVAPKTLVGGISFNRLQDAFETAAQKLFDEEITR